jgi:hypothetical protein
MDRTTTVKLMRSLAFACAALVATSACSAHRPVAEMARAERAVRDAETSDAQQLAPAELSEAQSKLARARIALDDHHYDYARRLADEALVDARLAESKAESRTTRVLAVRTGQDVEVLQAEAVAPTTVVFERPAPVEPTNTTVVTERPAPAPASVVIERREPPPSVIVERPAPPPATVVVERPVPPPASVVVERPVPPPPSVVVEHHGAVHEGPVVVVPE